MKNNISKLKKYLDNSKKYDVFYKGCKAVGIYEYAGILVYELTGPDFNDLVVWEDINWKQIKIIEKRVIKNPFI